MTTNGDDRYDGNPFRGCEVPLEIQDHIAALIGWVRVHPDEEAVRTALKEFLKDLSAEEKDKIAPLPDWVWSNAGEVPPREWLVQGWLPAGRVSMLAGRGGAGKSRLALQLAAGIASGGGEGDVWIDAPLDALRLGKVVTGKGAPVIYASWEDEEVEFARRLDDISGPAAPWVVPDRLQHLHIVNLAKRGALWAPLHGRHIATIAELTDTGRLLRERARRLGARLIVIDPLAAGYSGDENSRALVRAFVAAWDGWAQEIGCAILLVAHPPKNGADYAGSTDWEGAVRAMWVMKEEQVGPPPDKRRKDSRPTAWQLSLPKRNYSEPQAPLRLIWDNGGGLRWKLDWWETPANRSQNGADLAGDESIDLTL